VYASLTRELYLSVCFFSCQSLSVPLLVGPYLSLYCWNYWKVIVSIFLFLLFSTHLRSICRSFFYFFSSLLSMYFSAHLFVGIFLFRLLSIYLSIYLSMWNLRRGPWQLALERMRKRFFWPKSEGRHKTQKSFRPSRLLGKRKDFGNVRNENEPENCNPKKHQHKMEKLNKR
jgi:hypothetical protein